MPRKTELIFPLFEEVRRITAPLSDEQLGKAIRHVLSWYYGGEEPGETDCAISVVANMMLEQAARYDCYREQQRQNRKKKGNQEQLNATEGNQGAPKTTNSGKGEPGISPIPIPVPIPNNTCVKAVQLLNVLSGSSFRADTKATQRLIAARENEGYSLADIEMVIRHQCELWGKDERMCKYLRPETLFGNKFEAYLSDARRSEPQQEPGYILAPLEDPWEVAMRGADGYV